MLIHVNVDIGEQRFYGVDENEFLEWVKEEKVDKDDSTYYLLDRYIIEVAYGDYSESRNIYDVYIDEGIEKQINIYKQSK